MLKKRDLHDCHVLYQFMTEPAVFPYVRFKCQTYEEYVFMTKKLIDEEEQQTCISRTILNEMGHAIGTIDLYDIVNRTGFLATWIGTPYFGGGYNGQAKAYFFTELFVEDRIDTIYMKIQKQNTRSKKAIEKLPYVQFVNEREEQMYQLINSKQQIYDLYRIDRLDFLENRSMLQQGIAT
ncbi:GNAT family N-acetyltransferase [Paenibacillus sp. strain BS8-2]